MALGLITNVEAVAGIGPLFINRVTVVGDGAYPTGGSAAFQAALQAKIGKGRTIVSMSPQDCAGYVVCYDHANDKLKVYHGNNDGVADGPAVEVPNATDLSGVTFNLVFITY